MSEAGAEASRAPWMPLRRRERIIEPDRYPMSDGATIEVFEHPTPRWAVALEWIGRKWWHYVPGARRIPRCFRPHWRVDQRHESGGSSAAFWTKRDALHYAAASTSSDRQTLVIRDA